MTDRIPEVGNIVRFTWHDYCKRYDGVVSRVLDDGAIELKFRDTADNIFTLPRVMHHDPAEHCTEKFSWHWPEEEGVTSNA